MTTKSFTALGVVFVLLFVEGGAIYLSLSTRLKTNQDASTEVVSKLNDKLETYRGEAATNTETLLAHVDATQDKQVALSAQNQKLLESIDGLTKQLLSLTQQNADQGKQMVELAKQIKDLSTTQTVILNQHTQSFEAARKASTQAKVAAEGAQVDVKRAIRAIAKPTPRPWSLFGPRPSPTRRGR